MPAPTRADRHPQHDAIADEVRSWYQLPFPDMGFTAEPTWFGVLRGNTGFEFNAVTVTRLSPDRVADLGEAIRQHYGPRTVHVSVVDEAHSDDLRRALIEDGWSHEVTQTYLVHTGALPPVDDPPGFRFAPADDLEVFSRTKLMGFASSEDEPAPDAIANELAVRRAEAGGDTAFRLATIDGEPAGIVAWYGGDDSMIFLVATRVPFRGRGVASASLRHALLDRYGSGCRSVVINGDADDHPVEIYRSLGFTDEVYREHRYTRQLS